MITYGETYYAGMYEDACLMHYGIKGMKWGIRRKSAFQPTLPAVARKRINKKAVAGVAAGAAAAGAAAAGARKLYKKRKADIESGAYAERKAAKAAKRAAKKQRRADIKKNYKEIQKSAGVGQKLLYNNATRKLQAKNMVDKGMSREDAAKAAKKTAWRNTGLMLGAYGAAAAGQAAYNAYKNRGSRPVGLPGTKMKKVAKNVYEEVAVGRKRRRW